jgi:hypothetical protein
LHCSPEGCNIFLRLYIRDMTIRFSFPFFFLACLVFMACQKSGTNTNNNANQPLSYGDSVFYLKAQNYDISPVRQRTGVYTAFPDNLLIDPATGKITVAIMGKAGESQTGLRYKIRFQEAGTDKVDSTYIVIAGINYLDRIYDLSQDDTIISPVYNADLSAGTPSGTYGIQADRRLGINGTNGQINIRECIRRGMFDLPMENGEWEEVTITYRSNDKSNSVTNSIDVALYYYRSTEDIPSNVSQLMRAHQSMVLGVDHRAIPSTRGPIDNDLPDNVSLSKPRPPCVVIVGN